MEDKPVIIFAKATLERDYFRHLIVETGKSAICFEKEEICFDNLYSLKPKIIIARIDSITIAWRFVLALYVLKSDARLLIVSNYLNRESFTDKRLSKSVTFIKLTYEKENFLSKLEQLYLEQRAANSSKHHDILIGEASRIKKINAMIPCLKKSSDPVLISGEKGTGKERLARIIAGSVENDSIFVRIDCNAHGREKILDRLATEFDRIKDNPLAKRTAGTCPKPVIILLNNVNQLNETGQAEILTLLDGGSISLDQKKKENEKAFRIISTTEVDLSVLAKHDGFRKDLFYRLNVIPIYLTPLRQRKGDIRLLIDYFLINSTIEKGLSFESPSEATIEKMFCYNWPGNIHELEKLIDQYAIQRDEDIINEHLGSIQMDDRKCDYLYEMFNQDVEISTLEIHNHLTTLGKISLKSICDQFAGFTEKRIMRRALENTNWNRKKAAALLNISYKSMLNKMKMYEIV